MSSIPNSAMPHAYSTPKNGGPRKRGIVGQALGIALVPAVVGLGLMAMTISALQNSLRRKRERGGD